MLKEYKIEFLNLSEDTELFDLSEDAELFEPFFMHLTASTNNAARTAFKREMKESSGLVEGKDYKIEHITINKIPIGGTNIEGKDYGRYEIGYKEGSDIFFTGQILTAKTEKNAIDQFMRKEPKLIRKNVRANRI